MSSSSFEEVVQFTLERLHMAHGWIEHICVPIPTGFGKSLRYQAIPFVMDFKLGRAGTSITSAILVVSPLVSMMADQVEDLRRRKVKSLLAVIWPNTS